MYLFIYESERERERVEHLCWTTICIITLARTIVRDRTNWLGGAPKVNYYLWNIRLNKMKNNIPMESTLFFLIYILLIDFSETSTPGFSLQIDIASHPSSLKWWVNGAFVACPFGCEFNTKWYAEYCSRALKPLLQCQRLVKAKF